jgi:HEAT repeat protein
MSMQKQAPQVWALYKKKDLDGLIEALNDKRGNVYPYAAEALGKLGGEKAIEALIQVMQDNIFACESAAEALSIIGTPAVEPLIGLLKNKDWVVRKDAAMALGEIGDKRAIDPLIRALADKKKDMASEPVSAEAAEALGKIGDKRAVEPLIKTLEQKTGTARAAAASVLGRFGDNKAVPPLIATLKSKYYKAKIEAATALGELGDERAVEPLIQVLKQKTPIIKESSYDVSIIRSVAEALGKIGNKQAIDALETLKNISKGYSYYEIQGIARKVLRKIKEGKK